MRRTAFRLVFPILVMALPLVAQVDLSLIHRIKVEAFDHSKVMETLSYLSDVHGGRLTGSPEFREAAEWAKLRLEAFGVPKVQFEAWGPFGRSWSVKGQSVEMVEPRYARLAAMPLAWSGPTGGPLTAEVISVPLESPFVSFNPAKYRNILDLFKRTWTGKLKGKIVLVTAAMPLGDLDKPLFKRYSEAELQERIVAPEPVAKSVVDPANLILPDKEEDLWKFINTLPEWVVDKIWHELESLQVQRNDFLRQEGVLAVLSTDKRSQRGQVAAEAAGSERAKNAMAPPSFVVTAEAYNRILRILEKKIPVKVRVDLAVEASENDQDCVNIIGELPGGRKADEVVMIGAHFDSWHAATGATDNGAGSAVMIEVMRVLKALDVKLDRTVRIGLWSGEEQGLFGSQAYVKAHFADPKTMKTLPAHAKLSAYYNLDYGQGKIRGVGLEGNDAVRPIFAAWLEPFADMGAHSLGLRHIGGTDHESFDAVGLAGFQFIQDPMDYFASTHHTSNDTFDHCKAEDLMQAVAIVTTFVIQTANRPDLLPRKPLPEPESAH